MELLRKMLEVTMTRGAQSAGLVTYRQAGGDAQGCRARSVSGKRTDLARLLLSKFSRVIERRRPLLGAGLVSAPQLFQGHTRFATTSLTTLGGCHPHQWSPPTKQKHWSWAAGGGGGFVATQRTVEGFITHNGDLDFFSLHGVGYPVPELQRLLAAVLHRPMPDAVDSACIAGLLDLLRAKGLWLASARYGYLYGALEPASPAQRLAAPPLHTRPAALLSVGQLRKLAATLEESFVAVMAAGAEAGGGGGERGGEGSEEAAALALGALEEGELCSELDSDDNSSASSGGGGGGGAAAEHSALRRRIERRACAMLLREAEASGLAAAVRAGAPGKNVAEAVRGLVRCAVAAFFDNGLMETGRLLLEAAKGSFGLVLSHALDSPAEVAIAARGQSMSVAFYPKLGLVAFGSEAAATKAPLTLDATTPWWRPPASAKGGVGRLEESGAELCAGSTRLDLDDLDGELLLLRASVPFEQAPPDGGGGGGAAAGDGATPSAEEVLMVYGEAGARRVLLGVSLRFGSYAAKQQAQAHAARREQPDGGDCSGPASRGSSTRLRHAVPVPATQASRRQSPLVARMVMLGGNARVLPLTAATPDPVGFDIGEIPQVLRAVRTSFAQPHTLNHACLRAFGRDVARRLALKSGKQQPAAADALDVLVVGCEVSLWVGEQFASDLSAVQPSLRVRALSANKLLGLLGQHAPLPALGFGLDVQRLIASLSVDDTVVLLISHSGATFGTLGCCHLLAPFSRSVYALCSEPDTALGRAVGRLTPEPRVFSSLTGHRPAEPCSISVAATHEVLTHLLLHLMRSLGEGSGHAMAHATGPGHAADRAAGHTARGVRAAYPVAPEDATTSLRRGAAGPQPGAGPRPLGAVGSLMAEDADTLAGLHTSHLEAVADIVGDSLSVARDTATGRRLRQQGQYWAASILEGPISWIISALYILVTVAVLGAAPCTAVGAVLLPAAASPDAPRPPLLHLFMLLDAAVYIFLPIWTTMLLRLLQRRPWLHRVAGRSLLIGDVPWVAQSLEAFATKLFALSYSIAGLTVYSANPSDHLVHRHTHRVVRGALLAVGRPDGRMHSLASAEAATLLSVKQVSSTKASVV